MPGRLGKRGYPENTQKEEDLSGRAGIRAWGREVLGTHTNVGGLHAGRPGPEAEAEGAAGLKACLRGRAGRCVVAGRVNPGAGGGETGGGNTDLEVPRCGGRGVRMWVTGV